MKTVALGMSGGVDSSVAAILLKQQGYRVIGLFMKNWQDDKSNCSAKEDYLDVVKVCQLLNIPYYSINFVEEYKKLVFEKCLTEFKKGFTPNPDILCNKEIKFKLFLNKALQLNANFLATGHYCQNEVINNKNHLKKGNDITKDQSYFLYTLKSSILEKILFPIGHLTKKEVREIAKKNNLINANKKDSTGICFIGKRNFKDFLKDFIPFEKGEIRTIDNKIIGSHDGLSFYTIGQRKGLKIGGEGDAWFVVDKDVKNNILYVSQGKESIELFSNKLIANDLTFVNENINLTFPYKCLAKVRYRQTDQKCQIDKIENGNIYVSFETEQRAVTLGQSIVFYKDTICLGGAIITKVIK
ncbi:MAG: tRNA-specific 2-thiouridylase MnmA [Candidatus Anoxychlamydiales bacterium]|nr:tRNA-specific 2-thiouridylase MnmA [Candidatus Anoxychlamydiales bacterium]